MPDVTVPSFLTGDAFDPGTWRSGVYTPTPGLSLFETTNGHIEQENIHPDFEIQTRHVQPWQYSQGGMDGATRPLDYFDDAWGGSSQWYGVAGAAMRVFLRKDCSLVHLHAALFAHAWRLRGPKDGDVWLPPPRIWVRMFLDGGALEHTRRSFPESIFLEALATYGGAQDYSFAREERNTRHFSLHHQCSLSKGWHTFGFEILMEAQYGSEEINIEGNSGGPPKAEYRRQHRVRVYSRNVSYFGVL